MISGYCWRTLLLRLVPALLSAAWLCIALPAQQNANMQRLDILSYIHQSWDKLSRSSFSCTSFRDSKVVLETTLLYLPADLPVPANVIQLQDECNVQVKKLPKTITRLGQVPPESIHPSGLLYLPAPYIVPGGRFNEMYGWDSYFILRGLLADGRVDSARDVIENFFFEIDHYGSVLNANRTYYLGRSQPPFLSAMVMALHQANLKNKKDDRAWLQRSYTYVQRDYTTWMTAPHYDATTGLSRFADTGHGPVPEIADHSDYYTRVARWFFDQHDTERHYLTDRKSEGAGAEIWFSSCSEPTCPRSGPYWLTQRFYSGDRAMRESGFDTTFRFGSYGADTEQFVPVCLNSLLYRVELDLAAMAGELGRADEQKQWTARARQRKAAMVRYMWDARAGVFADYNVVTRQRSTLRYATGYYPLWASLATPQQAASIRTALQPLEQSGGISFSDTLTGAQWDKPYGWAPIHLIAVEGLRQYGYTSDADRIAVKFLRMVAADYARTGLIREKYDVVAQTSEVHVKEGYADNVIGFGWTNGTFTALLAELPADQQSSVVAPE